MGQRHQIYIRIRREQWSGPIENRKRMTRRYTIGFHHQWLWGFTAIRLLRNALVWATARLRDDVIGRGVTGPNDPFYYLHEEEISTAIRALWGMDVEEGYHHGVIPFNARGGEQFEMEKNPNPDEGDNNNGCTMVDFSDPKTLRYCFMSLAHGLSCLYHGEESDGKDPKSDSPNNIEADPEYSVYTPISARDWMALHYGPNWHERLNKGEKDDHFGDKVESWVQDIERCATLMTPQDLAKVAPKIKGKILNPNPQSAKDFFPVDAEIAD